MRLLATGDSHIGKGAHVYDGRLDDQEAVWRATLDLAREHDVDLVLHAGDLFDRRRPTPAEMLAAERPLVEHRDASSIPVLAIPGNHDLPSSDGACGLDVLDEAGLLSLRRRPMVVPAGELRVACLPWAPLGRLIATIGSRDNAVDEAVDLLVRTAADLRAECGDHPCVLLGHWSVTGAHLPNGLPVEQLREVVLPTHELEALAFDAIVLGHIHVGATVAERTFYVGSPMALDHGEAGLIHGAWLLDADVKAETLALEFLPVPSRPFVTVSMFDEVDELAGRVDGAVVRVRDTIPVDTDRVNVDAMRAYLLAAGAVSVTFALTYERPFKPVHADVDLDDDDPLEMLAEWLIVERLVSEPDPAKRESAAARLVDVARGYLEPVTVA